MANLGYEVVGSVVGTAGTGRQKKTNLPVMPEEGTLDSISFYADNVKLTDRLVFGVLRESDGAVIATSAVSTTTIGYGSPAWLTLACSGETLVSGEFYSVVRLQEGGSPRRYYDSGQTGYYEGDLAGTWPTIAPMPLTTGVTGRRLSGYITYTAAASGPASDSNPITLASSATEQTVQAMVATSVITAGSVFDSNMIAVEDDMQVTAPLTVAPATYFTIAADGTYTHDADTTIVIPLKFYSPTTEQLSYAELTLEGIGGSRNMTAWIEANGAGGQVNEAWITYMKGAGASGTTFNELMFSWLGGLGYTGNLSDRVAAWAKVSLN